MKKIIDFILKLLKKMGVIKMAKRTIQVGDNLSGKKLFVDFSNLTFEDVDFSTGEDVFPIYIDENHYISAEKIDVANAFIIFYLYSDGVREDLGTIYLRGMPPVYVEQISIPDDFGTVTDIDDSLAVYDCLKIFGEHEKVYAVCENMCLEETLTKEQILDRYAVIEGTLTLNENSSENLDKGLALNTNAFLDYPEGFTQENCVCLNVMLYDTNRNIYSTMSLDSIPVSGRLVSLTSPRTLRLLEDKMQLMIGNFATSSVTASYKIVLLRYKD